MGAVTRQIPTMTLEVSPEGSCYSVSANDRFRE